MERAAQEGCLDQFSGLVQDHVRHRPSPKKDHQMRRVLGGGRWRKRRICYRLGLDHKTKAAQAALDPYRAVHKQRLPVAKIGQKPLWIQLKVQKQPAIF